MKKNILLFCLLMLAIQVGAQTKKDNVKTTFQSSHTWSPSIDVRGDAVIVYGAGGKTFEDRVNSWRERGYITQFMTGIAWGSNYIEYFSGKWDGKEHFDEGQMQLSGDTIWHGKLNPYIVPNENFLTYLKEKHIKRVIDAGIEDIFLEEPEFWARAGYSEGFKREWKKYYGFDWRPQHESAENTYLSNKLKYQLYYNALNDVFTFAKEYGKSKGMNIKCYVPTHSLVNYSQWAIVSPEASLASLPCVDGYIAQVWTGTSRQPNFYNGKIKERVFETAFLEYGSMESMTAPTGRKMFFLTDPIEDNHFDWIDYKLNYQATFVAQLMYPNIANYEIMPWPNRIYEGLYNTSADSDKKAKIPRFYSTQMQVMINTLNHMPLSENKVSGSGGISVLMANSMMFQRYPIHDGYEDPRISNFFGQAFPFLKRGIPVRIAHIENVKYKEALADTKILLMSYSNMKPLESEAHTHIANWVKNGGILVYSARDNDPFQTVQEWWNTKGNKYAAPSDHLFKQMGISASPNEGQYNYGKGTVYVLRSDPKEYVMDKNSDQQFVGVVKKLYEEKAKAGDLTFKNNLYLERGVYDLIAVLDESVSDEPYMITGNLIDLFDPKLPIYKYKEIKPGEQGFFLNIDRVKDKERPQVLASASRIYDEKVTSNSYSFTAKSPLNTTNVSRILLPKKPASVTVDLGTIKPKVDLIAVDYEDIYSKTSWDEGTNTLFLEFENNPDGVRVDIKW